MAGLRVISIVLFAVICYVTLIDSASIRTDDFDLKLQELAENSQGENLRSERAIDRAGLEPSRLCYNQPCGWAIYAQFTRQVQNFITNTCHCPDKTWKCVRTDDDLSVSAYVYHCRQNTTKDDIEAPEDAD